MEEINKRLDEISEELEKEEITNEEVEALDKEVSELEEQKRSLNAKAEKRAETFEKVINVKSVVETIEEREEKNMDNKEYRSLYLKKLMGETLNEEERSVVAAANGAVPTETLNEIFEKVSKKAPMLSDITLLNIKGNVDFYVESARGDGADHTEGGTISDSDANLVKVSLGGTEIVKKVVISAKVKTMTIDAFEGWLTDMLADSIANAVEGKIIDKMESTGNQVTGEINADNLRKLVGELPAAYDNGAKFYVKKNIFFNTICALQDKAKNELVTKENGKYYILGYEVSFSDKSSKVVLANAKKFVGNMPQDIELHSAYDIDTNTYKYSAVAIYDGKVAIEEAVQVLTGTAE